MKSFSSSRKWLSLFQRLALPSIALLGFSLAATAQSHRLAGHTVSAAAKNFSAGEMQPTNQLRLFLGLPLRNQQELTNFLVDLQNPDSTNYHRWLTPEDFAQRFGPTEEDYQKVIKFAGQSGFKVTQLHPNRLMVNVDATVSNIESAFKLRMHYYAHPKEKRNFFAPDTDPSVDTNVPIMHVAGLDDYILPHRFTSTFKPLPMDSTNIVAYATGSSPGGYFMGKDFRTAYVPGVTNTGAGQYIAIVDVGGAYYSNDVYMYEVAAGLSTNTAVTNILASGGTGIPPSGTPIDEGEEVLDIDMALSMAPDAVILNYEGEAHDVFSRIATDNLAKQMTLSYGFGIDSIIQQYFQQFVAQGQSMSQASGDGGADLDGGTGLTGAPYSTIVGGTSLTTSSAGGPWLSDAVWGGSGGGISGWGIPTWQQGIGMQTNLGSISFRNYPDVAMPADNIFTIYKNGTVIGATGGTSAASPLWAGFMALVNQQAASQGLPPVGFANPAIYNIGKSAKTNYTACFHDIIIGNTFNSQNPGRYSAFSGYDLCTGWGSPKGSNTIAALVGTGTNDFTFYPSQGTFNLIAGGSASGSIIMTHMNGLAGSANFSISGLPASLFVGISPPNTTNTTAMSITTLTNILPGTYTATLTGTLGIISHAVTLTFVVSAPVPGTTKINLASYYNRAGIYTDGTAFGGGLDAAYSSLSANLLGNSVSWNGIAFNLGPANTLDVVATAGQTITNLTGNFNSLQLLATAVQGNQTAQTFTVTYVDNSTAVFTQNFSDWANPQSYPGEATVVKMPYRDLNTGGSQTINVSVYGYIFPLNQTNSIKSITLPNNGNLIVLSAALANDPVSVPLSSYYNRIGIYSDATAFASTGGASASGYAYSANLLGGSQTWTNTIFSLGTPNVNNIISATNQTISLPTGNYTALRLLAAGIGVQSAQSFVVSYTDNTSNTFSQTMSDWISSSGFPGESKAVTMGYRNASTGSKDSRSVFLYGYSLAVNAAKTIKSVRLPNDTNVIVAAISLVPNWPPGFRLSPFTSASANAGQGYSGNFSTNYSDLNGGTLTAAKVSGPAWLTVLPNGNLSGTPANSDANTNIFIISVTDSGGLSNTATMSIYVNGSPAFSANPFYTSSASTGQAYSATISNSATDPNPSDVLTYAKVSGPTWLVVNTDGSLSGTPQSSDAGTNSFTVSATDPGGLSDSAVLNINVILGFSASIASSGNNLTLTWNGGNPPYQVQMTTNKDFTGWTNITVPINTNSFTVVPTNGAAFYRVLGQ